MSLFHEKNKNGIGDGEGGSPFPRRPPLPFSGGWGGVFDAAGRAGRGHAALRCRIMYITESKTLNDFNEVQFIGVFCTRKAGVFRVILRGLHVCIVLLDDLLIDRDVCAAGNVAPVQPSKIDRHRRPAGLGLDRRQKTQDAAGEGSAIAGYVRAG